MALVQTILEVEVIHMLLDKILWLIAIASSQLLNEAYIDIHFESPSLPFFMQIVNNPYIESQKKSLNDTYACHQ